jgi:hypothetical protein
MWIVDGMFLGHPDPSYWTDPDPSINKQKSKKNFDLDYIVSFFLIFIFED